MIHEAGTFDTATGWQFCTRCGEAVKAPETITRERFAFNAHGNEVVDGTYTVSEPAPRGWPVGALVEVSRFGQCMTLDRYAQATCHAVSSQAVA